MLCCGYTALSEWWVVIESWLYRLQDRGCSWKCRSYYGVWKCMIEGFLTMQNLVESGLLAKNNLAVTIRCKEYCRWKFVQTCGALNVPCLKMWSITKERNVTYLYKLCQAVLQYILLVTNNVQLQQQSEANAWFVVCTVTVKLCNSIQWSPSFMDPCI